MPDFEAERSAGVPRILLITGDRGAGKSTLCERLALEAAARGLQVGGVACPAVFGRDRIKIGCRARNLASGEEWELGSTERDLAGPHWKGWSFSAEGFRRANEAVLRAMASRRGLWILDEIGPVELRLGEGLEPSLRRLEGAAAARTDAAAPGRPGEEPLAVLVVRPELLGELAARFPGAARLRVDPADRDGALSLARDLLPGTARPSG